MLTYSTIVHELYLLNFLELIQLYTSVNVDMKRKMERSVQQRGHHELLEGGRSFSKC